MKPMKLVEKKRIPIRDLSDFCGNWDELKKTVTDADLANLGIPEEMFRTIVWMRRLTEITCIFPPPYPPYPDDSAAEVIPAE